MLSGKMELHFTVVEFQKACISSMFLNNPHLFMWYYLFMFVKIYFKREDTDFSKAP